MKRCTKCGLPETYESIEFDSENICNICHQHTFKKSVINWDERKKDLDKLIEQYRGKYEYDCIIPFSGGKDSTFTLLYLIREYKIKPLVVQFNHGFMREKLKQNNERTFKQLGVDVLSFTPNWKIVKRLMLESLIRKGDFAGIAIQGFFLIPCKSLLNTTLP